MRWEATQGTKVAQFQQKGLAGMGQGIQIPGGFISWLDWLKELEETAALFSSVLSG